jgi:putative transposase
LAPNQIATYPIWYEILRQTHRDIINENKWVKGKFEWQQGFGAFTVGYSQVETVKQYIINQEEHHKVNSFRKEYIEFLNQHDVEYKTEYLFDEV